MIRRKIKQNNTLFHRVSGGTAFGLHTLMVIPTIERLGTQEQKDKWLPMCESLKVIGNYAQTEIGHGILISYCLIKHNRFFLNPQIKL